MNFRKGIAISFIPLIAFLVFVTHENQTKPMKNKPSRKVASFREVKHRKSPLNPMVIANIQGKSKTDTFLRNRIPQSIGMTFHKDTTIHLTRGHEFLKDVAAVNKSEYKPSMGEIIQQNDQFVFFRAQENHDYIPVALAKMSNTLYPISSVLHIKGATKDLRTELLNQGYEEYYYHAPLKFLSIKSESGQVMKVYSELEKQGYKVQLEVLKPGHKAI